MTIRQLIEELEHRVEQGGNENIPVNVFIAGYWNREYDISHTVATFREVTIVCKNSATENVGD